MKGTAMLPIQRVGVSIFTLNPDANETKALLLRRSGSLSGIWCQIADRIKAREKAWQRAIREEMGIERTKIWSTDILEQFNEADKKCVPLRPVFVSTVAADTAVKSGFVDKMPNPHLKTPRNGDTRRRKAGLFSQPLLRPC